MSESETTPVDTFEQLGIGDDVLQALDKMGWEEPTPVQRESFRAICEGVDLIAQAQTGTGKTGAFGIPLVDRLVDASGQFQALILAPTRELALQSAREITKLGKTRGIRTAAIYGGASMDRQIRELQEGAQIVSGTPGRVLDHMRRGTLNPDTLKVLILDEADEMLSMGFAKELNAIIERLPTQRQTLLFSATVDGPVQRIAERHLQDPRFLTLSSDQVGAASIKHFVYMVTGMGRVRDLIAILEVENPPSALIFCNTKAETEQVSRALTQAGFDNDWLTGDRSQRDRERVLAKVRNEEVRFLVSTDVAARGIDVSHLTHVINFTLPENAEQYVHRTGRTGRAGKTGTALTLVGPPELGTLYYLRLQYKIFPVERSLPAQGEEATRREADRVTMIERAFEGLPSPVDLAVARRVLTHPRADYLLAGLLSTFFGGAPGDPDELAAADRRSSPPAAPADEPEATAATDAKRSPKRKRAAREKVDTTTLYVNLGRDSELRASDLGRFFRDKTGLSRRDIGRIRVRDGHSLIDVPAERAGEVIEAVAGQVFGDHTVQVEVAKTEGAD